MEDVVKKAALTADQVAVEGTPFDTGRAKNNWIPSIGAPFQGPENLPDPTGRGALDQARAVVGTFRLVLGSIFITNSVPYIVPLNMGSSPQARQGITPFAIQAAQAVFRREKLLGRL